jgi:hypothetical protein
MFYFYFSDGVLKKKDPRLNLKKLCVKNHLEVDLGERVAGS